MGRRWLLHRAAWGAKSHRGPGAFQRWGGLSHQSARPTRPHGPGVGTGNIFFLDGSVGEAGMAPHPWWLKLVVVHGHPCNRVPSFSVFEVVPATGNGRWDPLCCSALGLRPAVRRQQLWPRAPPQTVCRVPGPPLGRGQPLRPLSRPGRARTLVTRRAQMGQL